MFPRVVPQCVRELQQTRARAPARAAAHGGVHTLSHSNPRPRSCSCSHSALQRTVSRSHLGALTLRTCSNSRAHATALAPPARASTAHTRACAHVQNENTRRRARGLATDAPRSRSLSAIADESSFSVKKRTSHARAPPEQHLRCVSTVPCARAHSRTLTHTHTHERTRMHAHPRAPAPGPVTPNASLDRVARPRRSAASRRATPHRARPRRARPRRTSPRRARPRRVARRRPPFLHHRAPHSPTSPRIPPLQTHTHRHIRTHTPHRPPRTHVHPLITSAARLHTHTHSYAHDHQYHYPRPQNACRFKNQLERPSSTVTDIGIHCSATEHSAALDSIRLSAIPLERIPTTSARGQDRDTAYT